MPSVIVTYTEDEIKAFNAEGNRRGIAKCPACGDSRLWKAFHETKYEEGILEVDNKNRRQGEPPQFIRGHKSQSVACEDCWGKMSADQRVECFEQTVDKRTDDIKTVLRIRVNDKDVNCPADEERFKKDYAEIEAERFAIVDAIRRESV